MRGSWEGIIWMDFIDVNLYCCCLPVQHRTMADEFLIVTMAGLTDSGLTAFIALPNPAKCS